MARFRALPYAKAFHEVVTAADPSRAEDLVDELERVAAALEAVPEFHKVLITPMIVPEVKSQILDAVLDQLEISAQTRRFLHVVQRHYRMVHMRHIAEVYRDLVDRAAGRTRARVEFAGTLGEAGRRGITTVMTELLGSDVIADFEDKPELLAGFRVQVGSKVFDGSLVAQVDRLSREMSRE
jgi:F-type H+-transporting ATPase subunit delta